MFIIRVARIFYFDHVLRSKSDHETRHLRMNNTRRMMSNFGLRKTTNGIGGSGSSTLARRCLYIWSNLAHIPSRIIIFHFPPKFYPPRNQKLITECMVSNKIQCIAKVFLLYGVRIRVDLQLFFYA